MRVLHTLLSAGLLAAALPAADLPRPVPDTTFRTPDGSVIDLVKYRGKVVALEFLLTTCPHCQKCSQMLQKLQQEYAPRGFQALGVATNSMSHMLVADYKKTFGLTYPVGYTEHPTAVQWLQHPAMLNMYMPQLVFIDRQGRIRAQYAGTDKFFLDEEVNARKEIEALLKESTTPASTRATSKKGAS